MGKVATHWIESGRLVDACSSVAATAGEELMHRRGLVRVTAGPEGTEVRWSTGSPCFASLYYVSDWLADLRAPYMLRYFLAGWFEERFDSLSGVRRRLPEIIARSDVHLARRTFVREFDPVMRSLSPLLQEALTEGAAGRDHSVDCVFEEESGRFRIARIGPKSTIARLWGLAPVSYPCLAGGSYDRIVSAAYCDVLRDGRPRYDHVYAAMVTPENSVVWIPYQRVIVPERTPGGARALSVVTEIAKVDIQII